MTSRCILEIFWYIVRFASNSWITSFECNIIHNSFPLYIKVLCDSTNRNVITSGQTNSKSYLFLNSVNKDEKRPKINVIMYPFYY